MNAINTIKEIWNDPKKLIRLALMLAVINTALKLFF